MRLGLVITLMCSTCLLLASSAIARAENAKIVIQPYSATYKGTINGSKIGNDGVRSLEQIAAGHFRLKTEAKSFLFDVTELAEFKIIDGQFQSLAYSSKRDTVVTSRHKDVRFDWAAMQAHYNYKDKNGSFKLKPHTSDPLTTELVIAHHLQSGAPEQSITIPESDDRRLKIRLFEVRGKESIEIPYGKIETIKVELVDEKKKDKQTLLWYAPSLNYLLVRVQQIKEDDVFELALKSYSPTSTPLMFVKQNGVVTPNATASIDHTQANPADKSQTTRQDSKPGTTQNSVSNIVSEPTNKAIPQTKPTPTKSTPAASTKASSTKATSTSNTNIAETIPEKTDDNHLKVADKANSKTVDSAEIIDIEASWDCDREKSRNKSDSQASTNSH